MCRDVKSGAQECHLGPALRRDAPELVLNNPERKSRKARLLDLPPMGIDIEAVVPHHHLAFIGDVGGDPGDELQIVYRLQLSCAFPISVADLPWREDGLKKRAIATDMTASP